MSYNEIVSTGECTSYTMKLASQARSRAMGPLHPTFNLVRLVREGLQGFLPDNAHVIATGRLHVSLTRVSNGENVVISKFESKDELIQVNMSVVTVLCCRQGYKLCPSGCAELTVLLAGGADPWLQPSQRDKRGGRETPAP